MRETGINFFKIRNGHCLNARGAASPYCLSFRIGGRLLKESPMSSTDRDPNSSATCSSCCRCSAWPCPPVQDVFCSTRLPFSYVEDLLRRIDPGPSQDSFLGSSRDRSQHRRIDEVYHIRATVHNPCLTLQRSQLQMETLS